MSKLSKWFHSWFDEHPASSTPPTPPVIIKEPPSVPPIDRPGDPVYADAPAEISGKFIPRVADVSHYEVITAQGFKDAKSAGLWGIIGKATQGLVYNDDKYLQFSKDAKSAGLLWGAYHFATGDDPIRQVDHFLNVVKPDNDTLVALDFEQNPNGNTMSIQQAVTFLREIERRLGRKAVIYSGNDLKEKIGGLSSADRLYVCSHKLWLAQYTSKPRLPIGFVKYFLWQWTGDGVGPKPHWVDGIKCPGSDGIDLNVYSGTQSSLKKDWAS